MRFGDTISDVLPNEVLDIGGSPSLKGAEALDDHSPANVTSNESVLEGPLTTIESPSSTSADLDSDPLSYSNKRKNENDSLDTASLVFKKPKLSPAPANIVPYYPNPKRSTLASQKLQHKKLTTPFRSPTLTLRPKLPDTTSLASNDLLTQQTFAPKPLLAHAPTSTIEQPKTSHAFVSDENDTKRKHRTQRASAPFKSPLSTDASAKLSTVRMTPIIQALERKIQLLRRAIKVKEVGEEDALLELVKKWTEAGRDIAWEVWDLVKDNASMEDQDWGKSRIGGFERSWGWDDKKTNILGSKRNWGWDIEPANPAEESGNSEKHEVMESADDNDDSEKQQDTLGTMLVQLGISPETLGWSEEEGQFRDRIYE
ncbi:hypothetical protein H0H87_005626 [Tephrocybe sp. NHM501043]|nr:hypothetical protein H0H87_005626 [Tephrocybe sp. NHM501043]